MSRSRSMRWAAIMDRPRWSRAQSTTRPSIPRTASSSSVTPTRVRSIAGELPSNVEIVHASQVIGMDEHPAKALREKKDSTILVATEPREEGPRGGPRDRRPHGRGHGRRRPPARTPARRRPACARGPDDDGLRPDGPPRHRREPRLDRREPRPVRADGRDLLGPRARRGEPARRAALDRRGEGQGRCPDPAGDRAPRPRRRSTSSATSRARTSSTTWPMSSSATRSSATS